MKRLSGTRRRIQAAFTLVELLIVIALTALLLGLLFGPIIQGFKLTNKATALARAQDATRYGLETLNRELSEASYVFDNSTTPIVIPLADPNATGNTRISAYPGIYPKDARGRDNSVPMYQYAKIDFIPSAIRTGTGTVIDPTTQSPLGGGDLRVPVAPNTRYVRYFIGLRNNVDSNDKPLFYDNVYEFPRTDDSLNPFIVWRAEYSPTDANLIDQNLSEDDKAKKDFAGIDDPNFFYNTKLAANRKSYARNWREISSPVLSVPNLDVLAWRRDNRRQIDSNNPFQLTASFSPSSVNGDTATPGFITNTASEDPGAVPSLYTSQFGQWVLPYTVTVFRGSTNYDSTATRTDDPYGNVSFTIQPSAPDANGNVTLQVVLDSTNGSLSGITNSNYYWLYSPMTGRIFITTPLTTFQVDPARGRIETAFPPLAATANGAPMYTLANGSTATMNPGVAGNTGELIETIYRGNTRDDAKLAANQTLPKNQGIVAVNLAETNLSYYPATEPLATFSVRGATYYSPFVTFGGAATNPGNYQSATLVRGSERVMGPDNRLFLQDNTTPTPDVTYFRIAQPPLARTSKVVGGVAGVDTTGAPITDTTNARYVQISPLRYYLVSDLGYENTPYIQFDEERGRLLTDVPGLPAKASADPGPERDVRVTFLWQNNYSRNTQGAPVDANNRAATRDLDGSIRPEPDVMKVNYATRSLMNVSMGARVYDTSSGQPQIAQVSDRIKINNVAR